jgi:hypothetical protein
LGGIYEATYEAGDTFVQRPGEYTQVGNATAGNARIMATALLPTRAPLTIYQDGFTSSEYATLTDWNYTHDIVVPTLGPTTVYRSSIDVARPAYAFELVQLVLEQTALPPLLIVPSGEVREGYLTAGGGASADMPDVNPAFERVVANLCVGSAYVPFPVAPSPSYPVIPRLGAQT